MKLITYYMEVKKKHLSFLSKNENLSFLEYNLKRWYFTERYLCSKFLHNEKVKIKKNVSSFNTNARFNEFKIPEINKNRKINENSHFEINNFLKIDEIKKRKKLNEKKYNYIFNNKNINTIKITAFNNLDNIINRKINKQFYETQIKKNLHTMNNQKDVQHEKGNIKENKNIENALNQIKEENNIGNAKIDNTCNLLNSLKEKNIETFVKLKKEVNDVIIDIKNEKNIVTEKGKYSYYINRITLFLNNLFEKHLLFMNCLIAGTLYFIADITCQLMEIHKNNKEYDLLRTFRMAFIGLSLEGPIMTWWYGKILSNFIKSKPNTFIYKSFFPTLFDNFIFGPIHLAIFFFYNGMLKNQKKSEIIDKILNTGLKVFLISLMTWTPLTLINFIFVPRIYQATVVFFADFFWVNFLSWCANKK